MLTALAVGYLVWQVTSGRLSAASAGAAAGAVLLLGQRLTTFAGSAALLFESSLFIEDFLTSFVESMPAVIQARPRPADLPLGSRGSRPTVSHSPIPPRTTPPSSASISTSRKARWWRWSESQGSGKTTLAKQLAGLYHPDEGSIRWDDVDVTECDPLIVRDHVAIVFQDFVKYLVDGR